MEMFNARINFELLPCIRRLYESIENLAKGAFEIMHEFNKGQEKVIFIEVQTGTYFGEDDIVRIEDDYNRT